MHCDPMQGSLLSLLFREFMLQVRVRYYKDNTDIATADSLLWVITFEEVLWTSNPVTCVEEEMLLFKCRLGSVEKRGPTEEQLRQVGIVLIEITH